MTQAIENVMTHGPCNDTWIRCHERLGTYGLAVAVGRVAAIHFDVAACPTDVEAAARQQNLTTGTARPRVTWMDEIGGALVVVNSIEVDGKGR